MSNFLLVGTGALIIGLLVGFFIPTFFSKKKEIREIQEAKEKSAKIIESAKREGVQIVKESKIQAKDVVFRMKSDFEREAKEQRKEFTSLEKRILQREENLEKKVNMIDSKEAEISKRESGITAAEREVESKRQNYQNALVEVQKKLEKVSGLTREGAKQMLIDSMQEEAKHEGAKLIKRIEDEAKEEADKKAKKVLAIAVQRYAGDYTAENTVSVVNLPSDDMKGRIIGREGRNIRAIEAATGVDLIIDDTPEAVVISAFDPVRREIAKLALERLIQDGRIHPGRIEEVVEKVTQEIEQAKKEAGEQAVFDLGVHGVHPEIVKLLGALKYRTSYSQNQYQHSIEVAFLCGMMAGELGLDVKLARRAGLLHDIGKVIDQSIEGSHAVIGADFARKHGEKPDIVHAMRAHHEDEKPESVLAVLVQAADALSGARPGARREMLETYIKRLADLEEISTSFDGVEKAYAIQAGREIRIMVDSGSIDDRRAFTLSKDIAGKIEEQLSYPGQIKVMVIREIRAIETAR